jgi:hypothetical protein
MKSQTDRRSKAGMTRDGSHESFIPMNDLLRRNHKDRVADYLSGMDNQSEDNIVSGKGMVTN